MPIDEKILLYSLANTFNSFLGVPICDDTKAYLKSKSKTFSKLSTNEKMYFGKYALTLAQHLTEYLGTINLFELNTDDNNIIHEFRLVRKKGGTVNICMYHDIISINDIIPEKLMKVCKYKKNTNVCKGFLSGYAKITETGYNKIKSDDKYSDLSDKKKNSALYVPICQLVVNTLSKKRKCADNLYNHLFGETDRIVLKLYKNRFVIYDFGIELDGTTESFKMKYHSPNQVHITFNNKSKFELSLQTNSSEIKEHLSLKFHTNFKNMDDLYRIASSSV